MERAIKRRESTYTSRTVGNLLKRKQGFLDFMSYPLAAHHYWEEHGTPGVQCVYFFHYPPYQDHGTTSFDSKAVVVMHDPFQAFLRIPNPE